MIFIVSERSTDGFASGHTLISGIEADSFEEAISELQKVISKQDPSAVVQFTKDRAWYTLKTEYVNFGQMYNRGLPILNRDRSKCR